MATFTRSDVFQHGRPRSSASTTLSCLLTIFAEEWEHHRYAVRDLDATEAESDA